MSKTINLTLSPDDGTIKVDLCRQGEYGVIQLVLDMAAYETEYGSGTASAVIRAPRSATLTDLTVSQDGTDVTITITKDMTKVSGKAEIVVNWAVESEGVAKSAILECMIEKSLSGASSSGGGGGSVVITIDDEGNMTISNTTTSTVTVDSSGNMTIGGTT